MTRVLVKGLRKSFGSHLVLAGLDLEVREGSLSAVLGPSGSGKTTLLRVLAGFERADGGSVEIGGRLVEGDGAHVPPEERRIGYVPQEGALFPHLDAAGNVGFGLPRRMRKSGRVAELLELVGLAGLGKLYPHQLSGGQQQRVAVARALATKPSLVLLDEPFSSLDQALRAEVRADVARVLSDTGTTAVLVTHDQDEALSLADQVAVLRDGKVAQLAGPEDLYYRPTDPMLARFVGEANILEATLSDGKADTALGAVAVAGGSQSSSGKALVLVRPEQLRLEDAPVPAGKPGTVADCQFYGHDMLVTVEMADGESLQARLAGRLPIAKGKKVWVTVAGPVQAWPAKNGTEAGA
jgi:iron(III) transport system ATP-binding protein